MSPLASISFSRGTQSVHGSFVLSESRIRVPQKAWSIPKGTGHFAETSQCILEDESQPSDLDTSTQAGAST